MLLTAEVENEREKIILWTQISDVLIHTYKSHNNRSGNVSRRTRMWTKISDVLINRCESHISAGNVSRGGCSWNIRLCEFRDSDWRIGRSGSGRV